MIKEELIKESWGYAWDFIDNHAKENALYYGWVHKLNLNINFNELNITLEKHPNDKWLYRPKSLQGIENNNGWVKINNEYDLPTKECHCFIYVEDEILQDYFDGSSFNEYVLEYITHYPKIN